MVSDVSSPLESKVARTAAANVYVHAFPLLLADVVRRSHPIGFHQFHILTHESGSLAPGLADDDPRVIVGSAWVDLRQEPVVLRVPHTHGRYINITLIDTMGEPVASLGSRTGEDSGADLALVGPKWRGELPSGLRAKRAGSEIVWVVSRLHAHSALDHTDAMYIAQRQCLATPRRETKARPTLPNFQAPPIPCLRQVAEIPPPLFFHRLGTLLDRAPEVSRQRLKDQVSAFTEVLGGPPPPAGWSPGFAEILAAGFADGLAAIRRTANSAGTQNLGWRPVPGGPHDGDTSALARAARAYAGMGAPMREDLLTFLCDRDESGRPLLGSHRYRIRFPPEGAPPVHDFWWLSAWPPASFDHRHGIGDRNDLALEQDGSLEILAQSAPPERTHIANWLPAPEGEMSLTMRLYSPRDAALTRTWRMPPVERLDAGRGAARRPRPKGGTDAPGEPNRISRATFAWRITP